MKLGKARQAVQCSQATTAAQLTAFGLAAAAAQPRPVSSSSRTAQPLHSLQRGVQGQDQERWGSERHGACGSAAGMRQAPQLPGAAVSFDMTSIATQPPLHNGLPQPLLPFLAPKCPPVCRSVHHLLPQLRPLPPLVAVEQQPPQRRQPQAQQLEAQQAAKQEVPAAQREGAPALQGGVAAA